MKVLIVEDEKQIAESLKKSFEEEDYSAKICFDGEDALNTISENRFDIILLDWRIPKVTGVEVCRRVREAGDKTPIILLTALADVKNKIEAFNVGADDYITKPFSIGEVLARITAVLRRSQVSTSSIMFEDFSLNLITHTLHTPKGELKLTEKEFELLRYFLENQESLISKEKLCEDVWKLPFTPSTNIVEVTIKNLRKKLEEYTGKKYIKTAYGEGYIFISN
ncbi:MAG: response regulator transcription factor [Melioribacteraceae bacterium]|nr:response regulator transcription factor [Melioribacteraceae bacterium]